MYQEPPNNVFNPSNIYAVPYDGYKVCNLKEKTNFFSLIDLIYDFQQKWANDWKFPVQNVNGSVPVVENIKRTPIQQIVAESDVKLGGKCYSLARSTQMLT